MDSLHKHLKNIPGWRTNRKIVVFESDDWGSIRMPSRDAFLRMKAKGIDLESLDYYRYNYNDSLESQYDLTSLFEILNSFKDLNGNPCVFTAVSVVANPDFKKIRDNGFSGYYFEPFTKTLEKYYPDQNVFRFWKEGIEKKVFFPQFHGREHLNVSAWMKALRSYDFHTMTAFEEGMWGFAPRQDRYPVIENQAAFQLTRLSDISNHEKIISEGLDLFIDLFGYKAKYFVPPNGPIHNSLNRILAEKGIKFRSAPRIQHESSDSGKTRRVIHWLGQKDKSGIRYITRNCFFEPSCGLESYSPEACLKSIDIAFKWKKPAIISSHRVNYIGGLNPENRESGLKSLSKLLRLIFANWPDTEFMTTVQLGELISGDDTSEN